MHSHDHNDNAEGLNSRYVNKEKKKKNDKYISFVDIAAKTVFIWNKKRRENDFVHCFIFLSVNYNKKKQITLYK